MLVAVKRDETGLEGAGPARGGRPLVWLLNLVLPVGVHGERDRDVEDAAREFFDAHGHWADEEPPPAAPGGATRPGRTPTAAPRSTTPAPPARAPGGGTSSGRAVGSVAIAIDPTVAELAERARATGRLGIDTEFMGEGRYRPLLCLVQVAVEEEDGSVRVEVLDPLQGDLDPARGRRRSPTPTSRSSCTPVARTWPLLAP